MNDLGVQDLINPAQFKHLDVSSNPTYISNPDDTDEDLDDLPIHEEENPTSFLGNKELGNKKDEPEVISLATIRENSSRNSVEEWSPSPPAEESDNQSVKSSLLENRMNSGKSRSQSKGLVQNYLTKWKNLIKK